MSEHFFTLLIAVYAEPNSKKLPKSNITPFNVYPWDKLTVIISARSSR